MRGHAAFAVGISGSTSARSRSRALVERTLSHLRVRGAHTALFDLAALPANALLAREKDATVEEAIAATTAARILIIGTPIYRATYTGQLKCFFDLLPRDALVGTVAGLIATGHGEGHRLAIDHGLRPLVASLGGLAAAHAIYATDAEITDVAALSPAIDDLNDRLADELWRVAAAEATDAAPEMSLARS